MMSDHFIQGALVASKLYEQFKSSTYRVQAKCGRYGGSDYRRDQGVNAYVEEWHITSPVMSIGFKIGNWEQGPSSEYGFNRSCVHLDSPSNPLPHFTMISAMILH